MTDDTETSRMGQPRRRVIDLNQYARQDDPLPQQARPQPVSAAVEAFRDAMAATGLGRPEIVPDGALHRFDLPDEARGKKSGWYKFHPDGTPAGAFGSWKHEISERWCSKANYEMSREEIAAVNDFYRRAREEAEAERAREANSAATRAAKIFEAAAEATEHPYLARKGVAAFGVRVDQRGELLIPMYNSRGEVRGVQRIMPDGEKRFLSGQANPGLIHVITSSSPDASRTVYVCEGYATGASLHMATGETVVIAFNAKNLEPAGMVAKEVFPAAKIIFAADNDRWTTIKGVPKNVGIEAARKAASTVGASVVWPEFHDLSSHPKDFNDLYALEGPDAVRTQAKGYGVRIRDWSIARLSGQKAPVRQWLVQDVLPLGSAMILAAPGGTGKGMLTLNLALHVSREPQPGIDLNPSSLFFGHQLVTHGPVVMLAAEDDMDEVHRRIENLGGEFPESLYAICLPDLDKPAALFTSERGSLRTTAFWEEIAEQIKSIRPVFVVIDPISCFVLADLNDRNVGAFVMGCFTCLARQSGALVLGVHHMNKLRDKIRNLDDARNAIAGSAGFVDHGRGAYVLWPEEEQKAKTLCKHMGVEYARGRVVRGGLPKSNFGGDEDEKIFIRNDVGLLVGMDDEAQRIKRLEEERLMDLLAEAIASAAAQGHPFQHTGKQGLFEKRERLPKSLRELSRHPLERLGRLLLDAKRIDKYRPAKGGSVEQWLDVPGGPFALGAGILELGEFENVSES